MQAEVGFSENPNSSKAGQEAARKALNKAGRKDPCDMVLLFCTASHNQQLLRDAVVSVVGQSAHIYGGGAAGIITNDAYGYAGNQVGAACIWLDGSACDVFMDNGLPESEMDTGIRLGKELLHAGVKKDSSVMLFYDAVEQEEGRLRLMMATWLLNGLKKGLGFLPPLTGAGMQGDHVCTPTRQFIGQGMGDHYAMVMAFSDDIRIDSTIMHGCRPASRYYKVTRAEGPMILEINHIPALTFMEELLGDEIAPEDYPFFLLFGINHGKKGDAYNEDNYASRLCFGIDQEKKGIIMFEPDMVEGTEFQLMFRALDLRYMTPKIEALFDKLDGREPIFAIYIDCAGRCAGYSGGDLEDALVLQQVVGSRVPVLGLYTGVEIAPMGGAPRGLDWTGVFCLFSHKKSGFETLRDSADQKEDISAVWDKDLVEEEAEDISPEALIKLNEQNAAKILSLDVQSIAIRHELEQKRRGFKLLAELSVSLRHKTDYQSTFKKAARRINGALNMQKTVVLIPAKAKNKFKATILQGYSLEEKTRLAGREIAVDPELLDTEKPVIVTGNDAEERFGTLRRLLNLPYFISAPVVLKEEVTAILITGRMAEQPPFLSRLGTSEGETVQAVSALMASVAAHRHLEAEEERAHIMLNNMSVCCIFWNEYGEQTDCNEEALRMYGLSDKEEFLENVYKLAPEYQPDGSHSEKTLHSLVLAAFKSGRVQFKWVFQNKNGELIPADVMLMRVPKGEDYIIAGYIRDQREQKAAMEEIGRVRELAERNTRAKSEFMAAVSHEIRTPVNVITAMAGTLKDVKLEDSERAVIDQGIRAAKLLVNAVESVLDYSSMEAGQITLNQKIFSVRDTITGIANMLSDNADKKSLYLHTDITSDIPALLRGDSDKLEQAVFHLTSNAIKFTQKGGVTISVRGEETDNSGTIKLSIAVTDTGIGIDKEQQQTLFAPFSALDTSYRRKENGLGMGLAVSRNIALMMKGDIDLESEPDKGSTFTLSVLLDIPEQPERTEQDPVEKYADLKGMHILVAEDNPINQFIIEDLLNLVGIEVVMAENGIKALVELENGIFDLILMDIQMPEMDGLTAAAKIRTNPEYDKIPILAMTANSTAEHREESRRSGMNAHLTKPVEAEVIYEALRYWKQKL